MKAPPRHLHEQDLSLLCRFCQLVCLLFLVLHNVLTGGSITSLPVQSGTMPNAEGRKVALITGILYAYRVKALA